MAKFTLLLRVVVFALMAFYTVLALQRGEYGMATIFAALTVMNGFTVYEAYLNI